MYDLQTNQPFDPPGPRQELLSQPMKLPFKVVDCTSFEENYHGSNLEPDSLGPKGYGWKTAANSSFPQAITLDFGQLVTLSKVQILCHQSSIPSSLDLVAFTASPRKQSTNSTFRQTESEELESQVLGYMSFGDNVMSAYKARELKTVNLSVHNVRMLKLVILGCKENHLNTHNQSCIIALSLFGSFQKSFVAPKHPTVGSPTSSSSSASSSLPPIRNNLQPPFFPTNNERYETDEHKSSFAIRSSHIPGTPLHKLPDFDIDSLKNLPLRQVTEILIRRKLDAAEAEDYDEAQKCKIASEKIALKLPELDALEAEKLSRITCEDFDGAKMLRNKCLNLIESIWTGVLVSWDRTSLNSTQNSGPSRQKMKNRNVDESVENTQHEDLSVASKTSYTGRDDEPTRAFSHKTEYSFDENDYESDPNNVTNFPASTDLKLNSNPSTNTGTKTSTNTTATTNTSSTNLPNIDDSTEDSYLSLSQADQRFVEKVQLFIGRETAIQCVSKQFVVRQAALKVIAESIVSSLEMLDHHSVTSLHPNLDPSVLSDSTSTSASSSSTSSSTSTSTSSNSLKNKLYFDIDPVVVNGIHSRNLAYLDCLCDIIFTRLTDTTVVILSSLEVLYVTISAFSERAHFMLTTKNLQNSNTNNTNNTNNTTTKPIDLEASDRDELLIRYCSLLSGPVKLLPGLFGNPNARVRQQAQDTVHLLCSLSTYYPLSPLYLAAVQPLSKALLTKPAIVKGRLALLLYLTENKGVSLYPPSSQFIDNVLSKSVSIDSFLHTLSTSAAATSPVLIPSALTSMLCLSVEEMASLLVAGLGHREATVRDVASSLAVLVSSIVKSWTEVSKILISIPENNISPTLLQNILSRYQKASGDNTLTNPCPFNGGEKTERPERSERQERQEKPTTSSRASNQHTSVNSGRIQHQQHHQHDSGSSGSRGDSTNHHSTTNQPKHQNKSSRSQTGSGRNTTDFRAPVTSRALHQTGKSSSGATPSGHSTVSGVRQVPSQDHFTTDNDNDHDHDHDDEMQQYGLGLNQRNELPHHFNPQTGTQEDFTQYFDTDNQHLHEEQLHDDVNNSVNIQSQSENQPENPLEGTLEPYCQFCGLHYSHFEGISSDTGVLTEEDLDLHYWKHCPMLTQCLLCDQVVEISNVLDHLLCECEKVTTEDAQEKIGLLAARVKYISKNCSIQYGADPDLVEQALTTNDPVHIKQASATGILFQCCPLCFQPVYPGEEGWMTHILQAPFCTNNPRFVQGSSNHLEEEV